MIWRICRVKDIACVFANAMARKQAEEDLCKAAAEIRELKEQLQRENAYLREEIRLEYPHAVIVGKSDPIRGVRKRWSRLPSAPLL